MIGVVVYLVVGVIVMRVQYSAAGVDLIPNKAFWKSLPGLIKVIMLSPVNINNHNAFLLLQDGVLFTVSPCVSLAGKSTGYSEMKS